MANAVAGVYIGESFVQLINNSALGTALADPSPASSKAEVINTAAHGVLNCRSMAIARILFGGVASDGNTFNYQVILWSMVILEGEQSWIPRVIAKGAYLWPGCLWR